MLITPEPGNVYIVKHSSGMIRAKFLRVETKGLYSGAARVTHRYLFQNEKTGREITLKSKVKIIRPTELLTRYHVGLVLQGSIAVYQYRTDKDCLSCELLKYYGEREVEQKAIEHRIERWQAELVKQLQNTYPDKGIKEVRVDFTE